MQTRTVGHVPTTTPELLTPVQGIRRELRNAVIGYIGGADSPRTRDHPSDEGWFAPDSVTRRVFADASTMVGGVESLLVQTLHPPTMAGVADHSNYKADPFGRLHRTGRFIGTTTFGSAEQAQRAVDVVRRVHDRVEGTTPDGTPYRANDPHNLQWVHVTEVDGFLRGYQRYASTPLSADESDTFVEEMAVVARALGVPTPPTTVDELDATLQSYRPELAFGAQARETVRWLAFPPNTLPAIGPYAVIFSAAVSLLPGWARRKLWIPPSAPGVDRLVVRPAAKTMLRTLGWILEEDPSLRA